MVISLAILSVILLALFNLERLNRRVSENVMTLEFSHENDDSILGRSDTDENGFVRGLYHHDVTNIFLVNVAVILPTSFSLVYSILMSMANDGQVLSAGGHLCLWFFAGFLSIFGSLGSFLAIHKTAKFMLACKPGASKTIKQLKFEALSSVSDRLYDEALASEAKRLEAIERPRNYEIKENDYKPNR